VRCAPGNRKRKTMDIVNPLSEAAEAIIEAGGEALKTCYQCGLCTATCPWNLVRSFLIRRLIHESQIGLLELESDDVWLCATCGMCVERCPRGVEIIDIFTAMRRIGTQWGVIPKALKGAIGSLRTLGNPWGEAKEKRANWAKDCGVKTFTPGTGLLYYPCCTPAYDRRARRIALATVSIIQKAGVDFGILGPEENCCGESVRKVGEEDLFQSLAHANIETFKRHDVKKILVSSPHCYHTFKNEYPALGGNFEVVHITQLLAEFIEQGRIQSTQSLKKRVTYHDPCYLGRHNKIYEEPRRVLNSIPGLELIELPDSREDSLCCGGGGGRIWMETKKEERFSDIRIQQALDVGAEVLAICCPYCMLNFDDSLLTMQKEDVLEIKDISEIVNEVIKVD
jgi:Fe-S oxidoreductase